jgi:hypothetical protein
MVIPPVESVPSSELPLERLRARSPRQAGTPGVNRVKDGLTIGSLRATAGPPATLPEEPAASEPAASAATTLRDLPLSGQDFARHAGGRARSADPLWAGLSSVAAESGQAPPSLAVLQARQLGIRQRLLAADQSSRLLQTRGNRRRADGGFGLRAERAPSVDLVA